MSMLFKILFFWLPSRKAKPISPKPKTQPKRTERTKRTKKK
tara:strand:- start:328 stop:450 length:123 start_codon:yes stop_codon:yes gene_type:complete